MEIPVYIKKEEDNKASVVPVKLEEGFAVPKERKKRVPQAPVQIDLAASITHTDNGLTDLKNQYNRTKTFSETNETNTVEIDNAIREMEDYIYRLYLEGEVTQTLFMHCNTIIEATRKWNSQVVAQQKHMETYILNNITYKQELHSLYAEMIKRQPKQRRDPSSPFNIMQPEIETLSIGNQNGAISSIF